MATAPRSRARARMSRSPRRALRLQRGLLRVVGLELSAHGAGGLARRCLRLQQRHLVRGAAGRGRRGTRLGANPSSGRTRWRRSSSRPRPGRATGTPSSATASSTSPPPSRRRR
jgi:hypothetical protein